MRDGRLRLRGRQRRLARRRDRRRGLYCALRGRGHERRLHRGGNQNGRRRLPVGLVCRSGRLYRRGLR
eukprot:14682-Pelagococcus_subviridis.AAC.1